MIKRLMLFTIALLSVLFVFTQGVTAESVKIITFEYPPYIYGDGVGMLEKIFHRIALETREPIEFQIYPRKRALMMFKSPITHTMFLGEREYFPRMASSLVFLKILDIKTVFVYMKDRFPKFGYHEFKDLQGKRVGISLGSIYVPYFKAAGIIVDEAKLENNLLKLKTGRIDFWHTVDFAAMTLIKKNDPDHEKKYAFLDDQIHTVELMAKKGSESERQLKTLAQGLEAIIHNGSFNNIINELD
ncbi:MAG: ABC transporter substrate-binding protein [Proteobacteria bacterium]|nr:ABC transporter substrate-binding protein [Pseudomonadota bacterium]